MSFEIIPVTSSDFSAMNFVKDQMSAESWTFSPHDIKSYTTLLSPGLCLAKLDGLPIGCISFNKYDDSYWHLGIYMIDKPYRGKGYGKKMFDSVLQNVDLSKVVSGYSMPGLMDKYAHYGFQPRWTCGKYKINIGSSLKILQGFQQVDLSLSMKNLHEVNTPDLLHYDTSVFGYNRNEFTTKWLNSVGNYVKVAVRDGNIVGYGVARPCHNNDNAYVIGPLFADTKETAFVLLQEILLVIANKKDNTTDVLFHAFNGITTKSREMADLLNGELIVELTYMTTNGLPQCCFHKWFFITAPLV